LVLWLVGKKSAVFSIESVELEFQVLDPLLRIVRHRAEFVLSRGPLACVSHEVVQCEPVQLAN
jgi:hypothetical protein